MKSERGFTLVEIVLALLILAISFPPLMRLFAEVTVSGIQTESLSVAGGLAQEVMEEIRSRKFDELEAKDSQGNWSTTLATDAGEPSVADFDDVDDFNGWQTNFAPNFSDYTATVAVDYVASNNLNTALTIPTPVPPNWTPSYKRVQVTVSHLSLAAPLTFVTVITEVQSL